MYKGAQALIQWGLGALSCSYYRTIGVRSNATVSQFYQLKISPHRM